jgi:hypothetical protein
LWRSQYASILCHPRCCQRLNCASSASSAADQCRGHEALVRITNNIHAASPFNLVGQAPCTNTRSGRPLATHAHGSASLASFDGWAEDNICFGEAQKDRATPCLQSGAPASSLHDFTAGSLCI